MLDHGVLLSRWFRVFFSVLSFSSPVKVPRRVCEMFQRTVEVLGGH